MTLTLADSPLALAPEVARSIGGWALLAGCFSRQPRYAIAKLLVRRRGSDAPEEIKLRVSEAGVLEQMVLLPRDVAGLSLMPPGGAAPTTVTIRRIGWLERMARMHWRVFWRAVKLPFREQLAAGFTVWRTWSDPVGAYMDATWYDVPLDGEESYEGWVERFDTLSESDLAAIRAHIERFSQRPRFRVEVWDPHRDAAALARTVDSVRTQLYPAHEIAVGEAGRQAAEWTISLEAGDVLPPHALYWFALEAAAHPRAGMIYADDDRIDAEGKRSKPRFKPDWSPTLFGAMDYLGRARIVRSAGDKDLVRHIPALLLHRGRDPAPEIRRVRHALPEPAPLVSIVIPTRDSLELLEPCIESVLAKTRYPRYELLVMDHRSRDPRTLAYFDKLRGRDARILRHEGRFNYSAINNRAAREARGELLCLLNNDTEVITPDWLEEMAGHLLQPGVGAVGAKLLYPDGRVQHGGVTVGPGGCAQHLHVGLERDAAGYGGLAVVARECSAVTAACLLTRRDLYLELGGLNERWLPVAFNDVDYCLRLQKAGWRVIWTPHAQLYHRESASRGVDDGDWRKELRAFCELKYMRFRWGRRMTHDPYYNPNFSYRRTDFSLAETARVRRPWRARPR
jgi:GT2 family glycosyltransferase